VLKQRQVTHTFATVSQTCPILIVKKEYTHELNRSDRVVFFTCYFFLNQKKRTPRKRSIKTVLERFALKWMYVSIGMLKR